MAEPKSEFILTMWRNIMRNVHLFLKTKKLLSFLNTKAKFPYQYLCAFTQPAGILQKEAGDPFWVLIVILGNIALRYNKSADLAKTVRRSDPCERK